MTERNEPGSENQATPEVGNLVAQASATGNWPLRTPASTFLRDLKSENGKAVVPAATREAFAVKGHAFGIKHWAGLLTICAVLFALRRPDALHDPKLWGEDGVIFLPDSFLLGAGSLLKPYAGYVLLLPRLWAQVTTLLPIQWLALSYTTFALVFGLGCCSLVLSRRLRWLIPSDGVRLVAFVGLLLLPGTSEVYGTMTNCVWFAGIALVLLSLCSEPSTARGKVAESTALVVLGLTGISVFLAVPGFFLRWIREKSRYNLLVAGLAAVTALFQAATTLNAGRTVPSFALKPGSVVNGLVIRPAATLLLGEGRLGRLYQQPSGGRVILAAGVVMLACTVCCLLALQMAGRLAFLSVLAVSVVLVTVNFGGDLTEAAHGAHGRYLVIPVATLWVLLIAGAPRLLRRRHLAAVLVGVASATLPLIAVSDDGRIDPHPTIEWSTSARCIARHLHCTVPLNPPGWSATLPPLPNVR